MCVHVCVCVCVCVCVEREKRVKGVILEVVYLRLLLEIEQQTRYKLSTVIDC